MKEDVWLTRIAQRAAADGHRLVFLQRSLLPVLQVEVQVIEQSREQMTGLEQAALQLCAHGFGRSSEVAFGLGLSPNRLGAILAEIQHRGLLAPGQDGRLAVTELGALSLQQGAELLRTRRALLLCGVTGRLLPAAAYQAKKFDREELAKARSGVLPESASITLAHVDLQKIPDRRAVNLPDEVVTIEGVVPDSPTPLFLEVIAEVFESKANGIECRLHIGKDPHPINWLTWQQALGTIEPMGFPHSSPERALELITGELRRAGASNLDSAIDDFGSPRVHLHAASDELLRHRLLDGRALALALGSGEWAPVPIGRFAPSGGADSRDLLRGRMLTVTCAAEGAFARHVRVLRVLGHIQIEGRKKRLFGAPRQEHFERSLAEAGISVEEARQSASLAGLPELLET